MFMFSVVYVTVSSVFQIILQSQFRICLKMFKFSVVYVTVSSVFQIILQSQFRICLKPRAVISLHVRRLHDNLIRKHS